MKANRGQIEKALDAPPSDIRFFLLYGPDEAGSTALARRLERAMGPGAERVDLDVATLREDPARLAEEGVFNVEEMDPDPFMEMLNSEGLAWQVKELTGPVSF